MKLDINLSKMTWKGHWQTEMGKKTNYAQILPNKYYDWDEKRRKEQDGKRRCRLATSEGAWVWQMLSVMTICPEQQRCWTAGFKAAPSNSSKWSGGEDLWTKGCAERGDRATPLLYNFNLWWMIVEERSGGDKYESICPRRSSIMPRLLTFDLVGEMDLFFVRKLSLRKLECINQIGNEGGMECEEKCINLNLSHDPYPCRELALCFDV